MRVNIAESDPPQVFVQITGGLSDGCTTLYQVNTNRSGNSIEISVTAQRPRDKACIEIYNTFVETVALGSDFVSGETYVVKVNDVTETFVMQ